MKKIYYDTEETITVRKKGVMYIENDFTQTYKCVFQMAKKLSRMSHCYMLWIISKLGESNWIPHGKSAFEEFRKELGENVSDLTLRRCMSELIKSNIIIKHGNGSYQINPVVFWKDSIKDRLESIKMLSESNKI